jgi:hypothetical protein
MRIWKGIQYRNDDCDGEKYIRIDCVCFFGFIDVFLEVILFLLSL